MARDNTQEAVKARYEKAKALIEGGMGRCQALDEVGMGWPTYNKQAKLEKGGEKVRKAYTFKKAKQPKFIDLEPKPHAAHTTGNVAVIVCKADQFADILRVLK